jgi:cytochrome c5
VSSAQSFFDGFVLVVGILVGTLVGAIVIGVLVVRGSSGGGDVAAPEAMVESLEQRIQPIGRVVQRGEEPADEPPQAIAAAPAAVEAQMTGPQVYNAACNLCHAPPGIGGAPPLGDAVAWETRVAQGIEALYEHAIQGFQGQTGFMPPKGGRVDLADQEVMDAVDFMVEQLEQ